MAVFLHIVVNDRRAMGRHANGPVANLRGMSVVTVTLLLGMRALLGTLAAL